MPPRESTFPQPGHPEYRRAAFRMKPARYVPILLAVLAVALGIALRLTWVTDMEYKGDERFIFVYDDDSRDDLVDDIRHKAADPAIALSWFDAAVLTERVRNPAETADL